MIMHSISNLLFYVTRHGWSVYNGVTFALLTHPFTGSDVLCCWRCNWGMLAFLLCIAVVDALLWPFFPFLLFLFKAQ